MMSDGMKERVAVQSLYCPTFCHFSLLWDEFSAAHSLATVQRLLLPSTPGRNLVVGKGGMGFGVYPAHQVVGDACENMHYPRSTLMP